MLQHVFFLFAFGILPGFQGSNSQRASTAEVPDNGAFT
jgi:hypothetical protein